MTQVRNTEDPGLETEMSLEALYKRSPNSLEAEEERGSEQCGEFPAEEVRVIEIGFQWKLVLIPAISMAQ